MIWGWQHIFRDLKTLSKPPNDDIWNPEKIVKNTNTKENPISPALWNEVRAAAEN